MRADRISIHHPIEAISMLAAPGQTSTPYASVAPSFGAATTGTEEAGQVRRQGEYPPSGRRGDGGGHQPSGGPGGGGSGPPFDHGGGEPDSPGGGPSGSPSGRPPGSPPGSPRPAGTPGAGSGYPRGDRRPQRDDRPRIPRQSELGDFNPRDKRPLAFWAHMEHFRSNGLYEDRAILGVLHSCMRGEAKDWFDSLFPRPTTWHEWRSAFFQKWTEDPSTASPKMLGRMFKPKREALSTYLYDKYWLIGMESVARLLIYSSPGVDATEGDVMPLLNQRSVSELVGLVHNGLPSVWLTRLYEPMETATLWNDYVLKMTKRESYIRAELDVWIRSSSCSSDSDSDTSGGRTAESGDDGGRFRKKVAATRRSSRKKIRASAVDTNSRPASSLSPLTEEERLQRRKGREAGGCFVCHKPGHIARNCPDAHNEKTKAYVRRVETACPRIEKLIYAALRGESTSGSTSGSDDDASSTSSHDIRRIR
ncbi:hypothetical protein A4X06_0g8899 [Tilletia controversa]|uniref:CCHC-type domain-containing protein n=1 Tax=Tilletia controversa TaxID=13291 RepID=A0A8X7MKB7_9BASI|nr:hypothetical protein A4X06_0g8899 [Tilletia controversa]